MLKNYLKVLIRNSLKNIGFTTINIIGLSLGTGTCLLIALFVEDELSFDTFHSNGNEIFRVISERRSAEGSTFSAYVPIPFTEAAEGRYPEIKGILEVVPAIEKLFTTGEQVFYEHEGYYAGPKFFDFFDLQVIQGNVQAALSRPQSLILTRKLAEKYFGRSWQSQDLLSQSITINNKNEYTIGAIIEDLPANFHLQFDYLISLPTRHAMLTEYQLQNWLSPRIHSYFLLDRSKSRPEVERKLGAFTRSNVDEQTVEYGYQYNFILQPLQDIHLYSAHFSFDSAIRGNILHVRVLTGVAVIILLLACANFINLSTAWAGKRAKEVGLRKVVGARRGQIVYQFLGEALFISLISLTMGALMVEVSLVFFNTLFEKQISLDLIPDLGFLSTVLVTLLLTGLLAGSYTAFYLSSFRPSKILKKQASGSGFSPLRKVLVVFQFSMSALLIMGTLVIYGQLDYLQTKNVGFNRDHLMIFPIRGKIRTDPDAFKAELSQHSGVVSASASSGLPGFFVQGDEVLIPERQELLPAKMILVDEDFVPTLGLEVISGRSFSAQLASDEIEGFILNEKAARAAGWTPQEAIGKRLDWDIWTEGDTLKRGRVTGVVRDFHFRSMHEEISPIVMHIYRPEFSYLSVKLNKADLKAGIAHVSETYARWVPDYPLEYHFLDEDFEAHYRSETQFLHLLQIFSILAIVIACLGLVGLAAFSTEQRQKEISIRKVYGATIGQVLILINSQFMKLILMAVLLALPAGYYLSGLWLESYAYQIDSVWPQVLISAIASFLLAVVSVSYLVVKASLSNPAEILRNE